MSRLSFLPLTLIALIGTACSSSVGASDNEPSPSTNSPADGPDEPGVDPDEPTSGNTDAPTVDPQVEGSTPEDPVGEDGPEITPPAPGESTRLARLSHEQYANTVQDLLGIDDDPTQGFAPDAQNGFGFATSVDFVVDGRLGPQYRSAAEDLAARVASDDALLSQVVSCDPAQAACGEQFVADFGARAFRRPLTDGEQEGFFDLFFRGADLVASGDDFRDGVALVLEAMLQSPQFLYRTEFSNDVGADGVIPLSDYEVASRLSYFIYNSMPDDELFLAAANGELSTAEQVRTQVQRMLQTDRALRSLVEFHDQAWHFSRFSKIAPDPSLLPDAPSDLVSRVQAAARLYVEDVVADEGGLAELLTSPFAYADATLAPLYGQEAGGEMERIELDATERKGLLMQVGFLAANAYSLKTDPVHRGLFVVRDLLCRTIPDPPPGAANAQLPEDAPTPETTREEITLLTSPPECVSCHSQINPPGFAFENFDAMGQLRSEENGVAVDTSGSIQLDGQTVEFESAVDLIDAVAESDEAMRCYATKWLEFAHGRRLTSDELTVIDELGSPEAVTELVTNVATTNAFLTRTPNEEAR